MKKIIIVTLTSLFLLTPFTKANSSTLLTEQINLNYYDLGAPDIYYYLVGLGYNVHSMPAQNGNNWTVHTSYGSAHFTTTVFTDGTSITGHEDIGF